MTTSNLAQLIIIITLCIISVLLILSVILQPSQKTGLIGDATDIEKREKRGSELFLFRATIILTILFFGLSLTYGAVVSGLIFA